jgi:hypothetical protein
MQWGHTQHRLACGAPAADDAEAEPARALCVADRRAADVPRHRPAVTIVIVPPLVGL